MKNEDKPWNDQKAPMAKNALKVTVWTFIGLIAGIVIGMLIWAANSVH